MQMLVKKGTQKVWTGDSALAPLCSSASKSSDLHDSFISFRGNGNGERSHEDIEKKNAYAGREWSLEFWRKEDLTFPHISSGKSI